MRSFLYALFITTLLASCCAAANSMSPGLTQRSGEVGPAGVGLSNRYRVTEANNPTKRIASVDKLQCYGISARFWVENRDLAVQNAVEFCKQRKWSMDYNTGTGSSLELTLSHVSGFSKAPTDAPDCLETFQNTVIDGCDGNDPVNNPHNYKYGGRFTRSDGWQFSMVALAEHVDDDNCDVTYKFLYDFFEIRGKNFPDGKLRLDGSGLLDQLKGCGGTVTDWYWELTPNDVKYQWYASGKVLVGQEACVGRAVISAGGSTVGNCYGSG